MRRIVGLLLTAGLLLAAGFLLSAAPPARDPQTDPRLKKAFRRPEQNGWNFVHLEGTPAEIGYQHGYLLAPEIEDVQKVIALGLTHDSKKEYAFFRAGAEKVLWPHIEAQYRDEVQKYSQLQSQYQSAIALQAKADDQLSTLADQYEVQRERYLDLQEKYADASAQLKKMTPVNSKVNLPANSNVKSNPSN